MPESGIIAEVTIPDRIGERADLLWVSSTCPANSSPEYRLHRSQNLAPADLTRQLAGHIEREMTGLPKDGAFARWSEEKGAKA